jgi:hypothetical protein
MIDERIEKTKSAVESAGNIPADKKAELLDLLSKLKPAIAKVSQTHHEHAQSIARLVEASAQETIRAQKKPELIKRLLRELKKSVENFQDVAGVATVHHALRDVDSSTGDVGSLIDISDLVYRSAVNSHSQRNVWMTF